MPATLASLVRVLASLGLVAVTALAATSAEAQAVATQGAGAIGSISGVVVDGASGAPLPAAQVRLVGLARGELTHEDGGFRFEQLRPGTYRLAAQRLGYAPAERTVVVAAGAGATVRIALGASAARLEQVVVTGNIGERASNDVLRPTLAVSGAELDRRLAETVAATLQSQPGVTVSSLGPATARPVIRGLSGDRVLVLEDGMRPGDLSSTSSDHAVAVDPLTARQLEVVRGPNSLLYGSSALGGVVNVVRDEIPTSPVEHAHGMLVAQSSSVNRGATAGGFVAMPAGHLRGGHLAVRAEGSARTGGDLRTPAGVLGNTDFRTYNGAGSVALVGERGHAGVAYRLFSNDYGIPGGFIGAHPNGVDVRMRRHMLRAEGEHRLAEGSRTLGLPVTSVRLSAAFTDYSHRELESSGSVGTRFDQQFGQADLLARHAAVGPFTSGAVGTRVQARGIVTGGSLRTPSTDDVSAAVFLVEEAEIGRVRLQGGLRYDWARYEPRTTGFVRVGDERIATDARTFGSVSGSLGALLDAGRGVQVGTSVARAYRTPDFNELYSDGPHLAAYTYDVGNPRLGEETGIGFDLFARLTRGQLRGEISAFHNALSGYVYPRNTGLLGRQGGRPLFQFTGRDAVLTGVEGSAEWSLTSALVLDVTVSHVRGRLRGTPDSLPANAALDRPASAGSSHLPFMPPLQGRTGVRYERPRWFAGAGVRAAARQDQLGDYEAPTAGYAVGDLTAGLRLLAGARLHTLTLRVDNLLDTEYRDHLSRVKEIMPEGGRNLSLLYRLTF